MKFFFLVLPTSQCKIAKIKPRTQFWRVFYTSIKMQKRKKRENYQWFWYDPCCPRCKLPGVLNNAGTMFFLSSCLSFQHCHHQCLCSSRYFECLATGHYIRTEIKDEKTVLMSESKNTNKYKRRHILWYMSPMDSRWFKQAEVYSKCLNGATALQKTAMIPWIHNGIKPFGTKME